jgi:hypothetical protein
MPEKAEAEGGRRRRKHPPTHQSHFCTAPDKPTASGARENEYALRSGDLDPGILVNLRHPDSSDALDDRVLKASVPVTSGT